MEKKYVYANNFQVKYCDVDFKDSLKISSALALMEEVACASAEELGFGYSFVKPKGYAFMVSNVCAEFIRPVPIGELVTVQTWPTPPSYVTFGREYRFVNAKGESLVNATSRWCLVDLKTNKILQSKTIENQDYTTYNTDKVLKAITWKISAFSCENKTPCFTLTIANSEYDHNMHVNNTRYADYCINCFKLSELATKSVKSFQISYLKQCKEGETLRFYREDMKNGEYITQGLNDSDEIVVQAKIVFVKDENT
jgi:acyl-ACP thioesterase